MSSTSILSSQPSPTRAPTDHGNGNNGNNGPTSSPLLFFVALGFGVVFTNLWIIVGVKYCFRYNRRRAAQNAANTEIDMANMPRPHRRRREKKLMTMDEVNQRFPLTKYKQWKSSRETEGLPSSGGIATAPQSRAPSIKHVEAASTAPGEGPGPQTDTALAMARRHASKNSTSGETMTPRSSVESAKGEQARDAEKQLDKDNAVTAKAKESHDHGDAPQANVREREDDSDDSDDDPIRTATAPELLADPGDTCAICIDLLEDDDDVRGLACGHAFHASCVDPWLTSRRACCPLCKADYYVPKPRPEGEVDTATGRRSVASPRSPPQAVWSSSNPFSRSRVLIISSDPHQAGPDHLGRLGRHSRRSHPTSRDAPQDTAQTGHNSNWLSRITPSQSRPPMFSHWFARNRGDANNVNTPPTATQQPTPGQLEAGTR